MNYQTGRGAPRLRSLLLAASAAACLAPMAAHAGAKIAIGDDSWVSVGLGARASVSWDQHGAPDGSSNFDASLDSVRLYVNGQLTKSIGATFNTERDSNGDIKLLDGYLRFEPTDEINVWAGRLLPPSDRSNLDGPYYLSSYNFPFVSQYPARFAGRDDGVVVWGKLLDKKLVYSAGVFRGHNKIAAASNHGGDPLFAGRIAFNFWEPEDDPGYYTSSTYYGSANILTVAVAGMIQKNGVGSALASGDYKAWNVDALIERKVGDDGGAVTLEGAYYKYDTDGVLDVIPGFAGASATDNVGGIVAGKAWLASAGYLFPEEIGIGKFQPVVRYQQFKADMTPLKLKQYDASLNYIIKGHNARLSLDWAHFEVKSGPNNDTVTLGAQLQF